MTQYFYDTWAILEYLRDRPGYERYFEGAPGGTALLNLAEVCFKMLEWGRGAEMKRVFHRFLPSLMELPPEMVPRAMEFRRQHPDPRRRGRYLFSYADALGYTLALESGLRFLTGDPDFKGMPGVEWVG